MVKVDVPVESVRGPGGRMYLKCPWCGTLTRHRQSVLERHMNRACPRRHEKLQCLEETLHVVDATAKRSEDVMDRPWLRANSGAFESNRRRH
jgi:uncharacterized C2H2 Zn-finger protein